MAEVLYAVREDKSRYGTTAIPLLAAALGEHPATLYRHAQIVELLHPRVLERLRRRPAPISWSHILILMAAPRDAQEDWLARTIRERLSVRQLARAIHSVRAGENPRTQFAQDAARFVRAFRRRVLAATAEASGTERGLTQLEDALQALATAREEIERLTRELNEKRLVLAAPHAPHAGGAFLLAGHAVARKK